MPELQKGILKLHDVFFMSTRDEMFLNCTVVVLHNVLWKSSAIGSELLGV